MISPPDLVLNQVNEKIDEYGDEDGYGYEEVEVEVPYGSEEGNDDQIIEQYANEPNNQPGKTQPPGPAP